MGDIYTANNKRNKANKTGYYAIHKIDSITKINLCVVNALTLLKTVLVSLTDTCHLTLYNTEHCALLTSNDFLRKYL